MIELNLCEILSDLHIAILKYVAFNRIHILCAIPIKRVSMHINKAVIKMKMFFFCFDD